MLAPEGSGLAVVAAGQPGVCFFPGQGLLEFPGLVVTPPGYLA